MSPEPIVVMSVLAFYDPNGLIDVGAPRDEYRSEAARAAALVESGKTWHEALVSAFDEGFNHGVSNVDEKPHRINDFDWNRNDGLKLAAAALEQWNRRVDSSAIEATEGGPDAGQADDPSNKDERRAVGVCADQQPGSDPGEYRTSSGQDRDSGRATQEVAAPPVALADALSRLALEVGMECEGCRDCQDPEEPFTKAMAEYLSKLTDRLRALAEQAREEAQEETSLRTRMGKRLDAIANALKGDPGPDRLWSWHDLPELAAKAQKALEAHQSTEAHESSGDVFADLDVAVEAARGVMKRHRKMLEDLADERETYKRVTRATRPKIKRERDAGT